MRLLSFFFIAFYSSTMFSQEYSNEELFGNWKIENIKVNELPIIPCNGEFTKSKWENSLKKGFLGATFILYSSNRIIYYSKDLKHSVDNNPYIFTDLINFEWQVLNDGKIELINLTSNKEKSVLTLKYKEEKLYIYFWGVEMRMEKQ